MLVDERNSTVGKLKFTDCGNSMSSMSQPVLSACLCTTNQVANQAFPAGPPNYLTSCQVSPCNVWWVLYSRSENLK